MAGGPNDTGRFVLPWGLSLLLHAVILLVLGWMVMGPVLHIGEEGLEVELVTLLPMDGGGGGQGLPEAGGSQELPPSRGPVEQSVKSVPTQAPVAAQPAPPPAVPVEKKKDREPEELLASRIQPEVEEQETVPEAPPLLARALPTLTLPINPLPSETSGVPSSPPLVHDEAPENADGKVNSGGVELPGASNGQRTAGESRFSAIPVPGGGSGIGQSGMGDGSGGRGIGWRQLLRQRIEGAKRYPVLARRLGMEGTVEVEFRITQEGSVKGVRVARSSGFPLLDEASIEAIKRAAPLPFVSGKIRVPISYRLHKGR